MFYLGRSSAKTSTSSRVSCTSWSSTESGYDIVRDIEKTDYKNKGKNKINFYKISNKVYA